MYFICGMVFSIVLYCLFKNWRKKQQIKAGEGITYTCEYDERQLLTRGKAYQYSFFTLLFVMLIHGYIMEQICEWCTLRVFVYTNLIISVLVFVTICIFNDAYFQLSARPHYFVFLSLFLGIITLLSSIFEYRDNGTLLDKDGKFDNINLECAILMFAISIIFIIKKLISKDEDGDAYEES
ncbi:MAG: hypothetical protein K2N34_04475 [Lachnospiraceae bacterium]|nr:hypothetical protein [Lachnospiraceae bacterium]